MNDSTLKELWQQVAEKKSCEAKQKELTAQRDTLADRLEKARKNPSWRNRLTWTVWRDTALPLFFYQVIRKDG